ncbi:MAG TPA: aminopeptidase P family protein [Candidatus Aenigmarchaeota archaeon]|nr:aminopeptidase P family protein [Candidatus Aenigmarchaeota archaeon]
MITPEKLKEIQGKMQEEGLDYLLAFDPTSIAYISGVPFSLFTSPVPALAIIPSEGKIELRLYEGDWNKTYVDERTTELTPSNWEVSLEGKIGVESFVPAYLLEHRYYKELKMKPVKILAESMRRKTEKEINLMRKAGEQVDELMKFAMGNLHLPEQNLAYLLMNSCETRGMKHWPPPIVSYDENTARIINGKLDMHPKLTDKEFKKHVLLDIYPCYRGYHVDASFTCSKVSEVSEKVIPKVRKALEELVSMATPGTSVEKFRVVAEERLGEKMSHAVVHGVGVLLHEPLGATLEKGNVVAIEPGVYKRYGVRLETTVVVNDVPEVLVRAPLRLDLEV